MNDTVTTENTFTQAEWEHLGAVMGLLDNPVFRGYVEWAIKELTAKHGKEIVLLNMKEMHQRLHGA